MRTCLGCRAKRERPSLIRLVAAKISEREAGAATGGNNLALVWDQKACLPGRGAWLCPNESCLEKARKKKGLWFKAFLLKESRLDTSILDSPPWI